MGADAGEKRKREEEEEDIEPRTRRIDVRQWVGIAQQRRETHAFTTRVTNHDSSREIVNRVARKICNLRCRAAASRARRLSALEIASSFCEGEKQTQYTDEQKKKKKKMEKEEEEDART